MKSTFILTPDYATIINNATFYLYKGPVFVLGRGDISRRFIAEKIQLPHLPILADNKKERELHAMVTAPWYKKLGNKTAAGMKSIFNGIDDFLVHIGDLYDAELNKTFLPYKGYTIEDPLPTDVIPEAEVIPT